VNVRGSLVESSEVQEETRSRGSDSNVPSAGARLIRLLVVDRLALEPDLEVIGEAGDATEAISLACALRPDVILMDVEMPGVSGIAATETLRSAAPRSAVVILTLRDDAETQEQARAAGAAAFVAKHRREEALLAAIRGAALAHGKSRLHDRASARREEEHTDDMREYRGP
jgi:DNA-binding NarL/FixJ family response regulator